MDIRPLQEHAKELKTQQGWDDVSPEERLAYIVQEVGEFAEELTSLSSGENGEDTRTRNERIGMEIYDVLWNLCDLANIIGIDLQASLEKKIALNRERSWGGRVE